LSSDNNAGLVYDLLIYVANWPERRRQAWNTLLPARAVENLSYVVGLNRIGTDGTGLTYSGDSAVFDFLGNKISETLPFLENTETVMLNKNELEEFRVQFPAWLDSDRFDVI
jgi:predicted amidohydrolase